MSAILLVDNLSSVVQYPNHTVTANEEPQGTEAFRFSTLRRNDHWAPSTTNADAWRKTTYNRVRAFDFVCLWDHNLAGKTYRLQASDDDFATIQTVFDGTLPSVPGTGDVDDAFGVLTEDLMWIKRFPAPIATFAHRDYIPAMGTGLRPILNGIVGLSCSLDRDMGDLMDADELAAEEQMSEAGYRGRGPIALLRGGTLPTRTSTLFAYEQLRYHLQRFARSPGVLVYDEARAEQAIMAIRPVGRAGLRQGDGYFYPHGEIPFVEHEPREANA